TYNIWTSMLQRCRNPKVKKYRNYGGRGIKVCERWDKFENFLADMGEAPPGRSIDRYPNNDGSYSPDNCRWATLIEQRRNTRVIKNTPATVRAIRKAAASRSMASIAAEYNVAYATIQAIVHRHTWRDISSSASMTLAFTRRVAVIAS